MATISKFSTLENYKSLITAQGQAEEALREAKLAQQAGIPNADEMVSTTEGILKRIKQYMATYFPNGTAPSE